MSLWNPPGRHDSGDGRLNACAIAKRSSPPSSCGGAATRPLKPKSWRLGDRWRWWSRQRRQPPLQQAASPAAATTSAPVAYRRRRPPQRVQKGPRPCPPTGVRTRPSKNATATSAACDVLYDPLGGVGAVRRLCRERHGCSRPAHGATVAHAVDGQPCPAWRREAALEAAPKPSKPRS
jgi:hypothetical protein